MKKLLLRVYHARKAVSLGVIALAFIACGFSQPAFAYTFEGSSGSGCTSEWCTGPGNVNAGWKLFNLSGSGPGGNNGRGFVLASPTTWATVKAKCSTYPGITQAYIFVTQSLYGSTPYLGLNYLYGYPGTPGYEDANPIQAKLHYDRAVAYDPGTADGEWGSTVTAFCFYDNPPWDITVTTTANYEVAEPGDEIIWTHRVRNNGPANTNKTISWHYNNNAPLVGSGTPPDWSIAMNLGSGSTRTETSRYTVQQSDFGETLCRSATAAPSTNVNAGPITSSEDCVKIAKKPKVQVLGGDLMTGRGFTNAESQSNSMIVTSQSITNTSPARTYGSWGEYGLLASGIIEGAGSGAALKDGRDSVATACDYSKLSFANATTAGACNAANVGGYRPSSTIPDVAAQFEVGASTPVFSSLSDAQYKRVEKATGDITLNGGTIQKGQWLVINAQDHAVTITGNITYTTDTLNGLSDIPQLIIIADRINIAAGVTQVDAWLVAKGTNGAINTCSDVAPGGNLSALICNNTLAVNGPVMAEKIYLQRTARADTPSNIGDPAETFTLRADAYLWAMARSFDGIHITVSSTRELPPRF